MHREKWSSRSSTENRHPRAKLLSKEVGPPGLHVRWPNDARAGTRGGGQGAGGRREGGGGSSEKICVSILAVYEYDKVRKTIFSGLLRGEQQFPGTICLLVVIFR